MSKTGRHSRIMPTEDSACIYCGASSFLTRDHFPVPDRYGGQTVVWACRPCHDRKDRMFLDQIPLAFQIPLVQRIWAEADPLERIVLAKMLTLVLDSANAVANLEAGNTDAVFQICEQWWADVDIPVQPFLTQYGDEIVLDEPLGARRR